MRLFIADRAKWTLEYVDTLGMRDVQDLLGYWEGKAKAEK